MLSRLSPTEILKECQQLTSCEEATDLHLYSRHPEYNTWVKVSAHLSIFTSILPKLEQNLLTKVVTDKYNIEGIQLFFPDISSSLLESLVRLVYTGSFDINTIDGKSLEFLTKMFGINSNNLVLSKVEFEEMNNNVEVKKTKNNKEPDSFVIKTEPMEDESGKVDPVVEAAKIMNRPKRKNNKIGSSGMSSGLACDFKGCNIVKENYQLKRHHLASHFVLDMMTRYPEAFEKKECTICQKKLAGGRLLLSEHILFVHNLLRECLEPHQKEVPAGQENADSNSNLSDIVIKTEPETTYEQPAKKFKIDLGKEEPVAEQKPAEVEEPSVEQKSENMPEEETKDEGLCLITGCGKPFKPGMKRHHIVSHYLEPMIQKHTRSFLRLECTVCSRKMSSKLNIAEHMLFVHEEVKAFLTEDEIKWVMPGKKRGRRPIKPLVTETTVINSVIQPQAAESNDAVQPQAMENNKVVQPQVGEPSIAKTLEEKLEIHNPVSENAAETKEEQSPGETEGETDGNIKCCLTGCNRVFKKHTLMKTHVAVKHFMSQIKDKYPQDFKATRCLKCKIPYSTEKKIAEHLAFYHKELNNFLSPQELGNLKRKYIKKNENRFPELRNKGNKEVEVQQRPEEPDSTTTIKEEVKEDPPVDEENVLTKNLESAVEHLKRAIDTLEQPKDEEEENHPEPIEWGDQAEDNSNQEMKELEGLKESQEASDSDQVEIEEPKLESEQNVEEAAPTEEAPINEAENEPMEDEEAPVNEAENEPMEEEQEQENEPIEPEVDESEAKPEETLEYQAEIHPEESDSENQPEEIEDEVHPEENDFESTRGINESGSRPTDESRPSEDSESQPESQPEWSEAENQPESEAQPDSQPEYSSAAENQPEESPSENESHPESSESDRPKSEMDLEDNDFEENQELEDILKDIEEKAQEVVTDFEKTLSGEEDNGDGNETSEQQPQEDNAESSTEQQPQEIEYNFKEEMMPEDELGSLADNIDENIM